MNHTLKLRRAVDRAIQEAFHDILCAHTDDFSRDNPPEMWTDEQKRIFDAISDAQFKVETKVEEAFES